MAIRVKFTDQPNVVFEVDTPEEAAALAELNKSNIAPAPGTSGSGIQGESAESTNGRGPELDDNLLELLRVLASSETGLTGQSISEQIGKPAKALGPLFGNLNRWARQRYNLPKGKVIKKERRRVEGTNDYKFFSSLHPSLRSRIIRDKELRIIENEE